MKVIHEDEDLSKGDRVNYPESSHMRLVVQFIDKAGDHIVRTMVAHSFTIMQPYEKAGKLPYILVAVEPKMDRSFCRDYEIKFHNWMVWTLHSIPGNQPWGNAGPEFDKRLTDKEIEEHEYNIK